MHSFAPHSPACGKKLRLNLVPVNALAVPASKRSLSLRSVVCNERSPLSRAGRSESCMSPERRRSPWERRTDGITAANLDRSKAPWCVQRPRRLLQCHQSWVPHSVPCHPLQSQPTRGQQVYSRQCTPNLAAPLSNLSQISPKDQLFSTLPVAPFQSVPRTLRPLGESHPRAPELPHPRPATVHRRSVL